MLLFSGDNDFSNFLVITSTAAISNLQYTSRHLFLLIWKSNELSNAQLNIHYGWDWKKAKKSALAITESGFILL